MAGSQASAPHPSCFSSCATAICGRVHHKNEGRGASQGCQQQPLGQCVRARHRTQLVCFGLHCGTQ